MSEENELSTGMIPTRLSNSVTNEPNRDKFCFYPFGSETKFSYSTQHLTIFKGESNSNGLLTSWEWGECLNV